MSAVTVLSANHYQFLASACRTNQRRNRPRNLFFKRLALSILLTAAGLTIPAKVFAQKQRPTLASEWKGEYLDNRYGAFYATMRLAPSLGGSLTTVTVELYNLLTKTTYIFSTPPGRSDSFPVKIFKFPAGKYLVKSVQMVDPQGNRRAWHISRNRSTQRSIIIQKQRLSNAGLWSIYPQDSKQLAIKFEMIETSYTEDQAPEDSSLDAIINGYNGLIQKRLGGAAIREKAAKGYSNAKTIRNAVKFTRQIAMFYTLDLFQHNYFARSASEIINTYDPSLRTCYTELLERDATQKGQIKFTFILSKETGTMIKLRASDMTIKDPKMIECIYQLLAQMQFSAPQSMVGQIKFDFSVQ